MFYWFAIYFLEIIKLDIVLFRILNYEYKKLPLVITTLFTLGIILLIEIFNMNDYYLTYIIGCAAVIGVILSLSRLRSKLMVLLIFLTICVIDMLLGGLFVLSLGYGIEDLYTNKILEVFANSLSIFVLILVLFIKNLYKINISKYSFQRRYIVILLFGIVGIGLSIASVQMLGLMEQNNRFQILTILGISLSGIIFIIISMTLLILQDRKRYYQELSMMNHTLLEQQQIYYKTLLDKEVETRKFRHDITNHIFCITLLVESHKYDEVYEYLSTMQDNIKTLKIDIETGNDIVNIIANDILIKTKDTSTVLEWNGILPSKLRISSMDLCTIFSNLLINAVEATEKINTHDTLKIQVKVKQLNTSIWIQIVNPISEQVKIVNNKLKSSKQEDKYSHGFGSLNVENTVNKYNGSLEYKSTEDNFITEILFTDIVLE